MLFLEPQAGQRYALVTRHRTKEDFAKAIRYWADELYPEAPVIELVLDNLNTHTADVLIEIFGKAEAERLLNRLHFHYTPVHGSWLHMAEIELSVMPRQCLKRRVCDEFMLRFTGRLPRPMLAGSLPSTTPPFHLVRVLA